MKPSSRIIKGLVIAAFIILSGMVWAQYRWRVASRAESQQRTASLPVPTAANLGETPAAPPASDPTDTRGAWNERALLQRIETLERSVATLTAAHEQLIQRGDLPLPPERREDFVRTLMDGTRTERERLQALRLIRRNRALTDDLVQYAAGWMESITEGRVREDLLQQLEGLTNAALRDPLLRMATADMDSGVRERAMENLEPFLSDPAVETALWDRMRNDPDEDVREQAGDVLREGRRTEAQLASLRARALDPQASLEEQVTAVRALREAELPIPDVLNALVQRAGTTTNPQERAALYDAMDGFDVPELKAPLVGALQDPNPVVRQRAADALSTFAADPAVQEWLKHVAQNDPDPRVQREALDALPDP